MRVIGVLSGKGGVGKTTSAINLAAGLNYFGKETIVLDGNLTTPNIGIHLGFPTNPISMHHVLSGKNKITEAVYRHPTGLLFVPGSLAVEDMEKLKVQNFKAIKGLDADFLIIDGAAGLGKEALATMENAEELIIVTNPELPAITDALKTIKIAEELGKNILGVLVTRQKKDNLDISLRNIEAMLEKSIIGVIPEDRTLREALVAKDTIIYTHPRAPAARSYLKLAGAICGKEMDDDIKLNWIDRFFKLFRKEN